MNCKKRQLFCLLLLGNILIMCNLLSVKPGSSFVAVNDNFHYSYRESVYAKQEDIEHGSTLIDEYSEDWSEDIRIVEIDTDNKQIQYERVDEDGENNLSSYFGWDSYIINYFDFTDFFHFNYIWNLDTDKPILRDFYFNFYNFRFIENNWSAINSHLSDMLNESTIIDTVYNPNNMSDIEEITFGDFLGSLKSYKIQGRSSISNARKQFTDSTTKWSYKFDLSGVMHYLDHYNTTFGYNIYLPIEKMIIEITMECTEDGARKSRNEYRELENVYSDDEIKVTSIMQFESVLGKLPLRLSFSYLAFVPAILFIVIVVRIKNRKR